MQLKLSNIGAMYCNEIFSEAKGNRKYNAGENESEIYMKANQLI